jgi:hypothetical protein
LVRAGIALARAGRQMARRRRIMVREVGMPDEPSKPSVKGSRTRPDVVERGVGAQTSPSQSDAAEGGNARRRRIGTYSRARAAAAGDVRYGPARPVSADTSPDRRVQDQLRTIFRGRVPTDAGEIVAALNRLFPRKEKEGQIEYDYAPLALGGVGELGRGLSATQASLFARATAVLADTKVTLETLKPQKAAADAENVQAIRLLVLREAGELVDELGRAGGSRVERVDTLFDILNGDTDLLGRLAEEYGLTRSEIQTVEENDNFISYEVIRTAWQRISESWTDFKALQEGDFGVQSGKLMRELKLVAASVDDVESALDAINVDVTDREESLIGDNDLSLDGLLGWVRHVALDEGPQAVNEGGKVGVRALIPTLTTLTGIFELDWGFEFLNDEGVADALTVLTGHLEAARDRAEEIAGDVAGE